MKQAVIDIGTNSTRLMVADVSPQGIENPQKYLETTRIGEGLSKEAVLRTLPMTRTADAIEKFVRLAEELGASRTFIYATAAVREAQNASEFADMVLARSGIPLHILPGEDEARIAFAGACAGEEHCAVIDIGGGSTEVMLKNASGELSALSQKIGAVRLMERFSLGDGHLCRGTVMQVNDFLRPYMERFAAIGAGHAQKLIGVSGTPTTLAAMHLGLKEYSGAAVQGCTLSLERVTELAARLFEAPLPVRKTIIGVPPARADIIPYGALILIAFMRRFDYREITVSDRDSLEGYLQIYGNR